MKNILNKYLGIIIFCIALLAILIFYVVKIIALLKNESRINKFTIKSEEDGVSLIDDFAKIFNKFIKLLSKIGNKSKVLTDYANKLSKYLIYEKNPLYSSMDYISFKFVIMFFIQILYILSIEIKYLSFNFYGFVLTSVIAFFALDLRIIINFRQKKKLIEEQLLQAIVIMNSAFKSGKNISQAIDIVKEELQSPIKEEFMIVAKDLNYGLDLETVFKRFAKRVEVEEAKYITSSLALLNKTGGNIVTVFSMIERNFYERLKIKNELSALTSSSRYMYRMLLVLPFIFIFIIVVLNPTYFAPLIATPLGRVIIGTMIILYILYIIVIKRVMKVDSV